MTKKYRLKILALFFLLPAVGGSAFAQIVNEIVKFDLYVSPTNHDFVNRFNGGLGLTQITTNGISGGCLTTPATMNWGNDNAIYCSKYVADSGWYCKTTLAFKYDTVLFNSSASDRAVSMFIRPNADFNHYVIASVSHSQRIEILSYAWTNSPGPVLNLVHDHWYEFLLRVYFLGGPTGDQIDLTASVLDLGITGFDPPVLVNTSSGSINDSVLFADTAIQVSFTATSDGGAKYIDEFKFEGIKSADSCNSIPTAIQQKLTEDFSVFVSGNELVIQNISVTGRQTVEIYSANGTKIYSTLITSAETGIDISDLVPGIYFVRIQTPDFSFTKKIAVFR